MKKSHSSQLLQTGHKKWDFFEGKIGGKKDVISVEISYTHHAVVAASKPAFFSFTHPVPPTDDMQGVFLK